MKRYNGHAPYIYGPPKDHKENIPLVVGGPTYDLSIFLSHSITKILGEISIAISETIGCTRTIKLKVSCHFRDVHGILISKKSPRLSEIFAKKLKRLCFLLSLLQ